jgi:phospholipid N-methyltransferase
MVNKNSVTKIYNLKRKQKGSHSIANERALELLRIMAQLDNTANPILEIGAGIGTITQVLLEKTDDMIYAQEHQKNCFDRLIKISRKFPNRLSISSNIEVLPYKYIIIDGPYNKKQMRNALKVSKGTLNWVAIENSRTATRIQIASSLFRVGYRQSTVEFRRSNYKPSLTFFYVYNPPYRQYFQITLDYFISCLKYWPKYLRLILKKGGSKHFRVGKKIEGEFGKL